MSRLILLYGRWLCAWLLPLMHSICLFLFTVAYVMDRDPNRGLLWLVPYFGDMPSSLASERLLHASASLTPRVALYFVLGGVQWLIIGILLDLLLGTKSRTPHDT